MADIRMDRVGEQLKRSTDLATSGVKRGVNWLEREAGSPARRAVRRTGRGIERFGRRLWGR
jgi:hypothetical protein